MQVPPYCKHCKLYVDVDHWYWQRSQRCRVGGYWRCKRVNRDNVKRWRKDSFTQARLTAYIQADKKRGFECTLALEDLDVFLSKPCYYCGNKHSGGLDRMSSDRGHVVGNVVPCCEKCNYILGDIPFYAKDALKGGLHKMQHDDLLKDWIVPIKRKH